jgi:hypothetical protein
MSGTEGIESDQILNRARLFATHLEHALDAIGRNGFLPLTI